jgi:diaminopimelate decarboxylase
VDGIGMDRFEYRDGQLYCEQMSLDDLASRVGTPVYVYSRQTFEMHYRRLAEAFSDLDALICYSIKSCSNIHLCKLLVDLGAGMDVVSGGELFRAEQAGVKMDKVVYAGVGKTDDEIRQALSARIGLFNIESEAEFENIAGIARRMGCVAKAALRINPDVVDPNTHVKTATGGKQSKFGVSIERARQFFDRYGRDAHLRPVGIHLHIGSPIYSADPYVQAIERALKLIEKLEDQGYPIEVLDIGGGYAADYETGRSPTAADYAAQIVPLLKPFVADGGRVIIEPGRSISGNAGVLLARVQYVKLSVGRKFVVLDSGQNHLIRPAFYDAFHFVWPTQVAPMHEPSKRLAKMDMSGLEPCDVVGPVCESGDAFAKGRPLPPITRGDLLCIFTAGAYGMCMASNYNAMPRPPEVLVSNDDARIIRRRETYEDMIEQERETERI